MNKIVASFDSQTPLYEIVKNSEPGVLFFHNRNHPGSYQLLITSMDEFAKKNVKHFYLQISTIFNDRLAEHRTGKIESLDSIIHELKNPILKDYLKRLIEKAHSVGIQVFAVDPKQKVLSHGETIGEPKKQQEMLDHYSSLDNELTKNISGFTKLLGKQEKFIGLFGSLRISICDKSQLNTPSILFHADDMLTFFFNYQPSKIDTNTERERKHIDCFDIVVMTPQDFEDKIDTTKEVSSGAGIKLLNQFLSTYEIPITCKGYAHTNSSTIDGVVVVNKEKINSVWKKTCEFMDPIGKRMIQEDTNAVIIFSDVESEETRSILEIGIRKSKQHL